MAHITLSIPDEIYNEIKKIKEINWSEIARRAIIAKYLIIKGEKEGLTKEELDLLEETLGIERIEEVKFPYDKELEIVEKIRKKGRERVIM